MIFSYTFKNDIRKRNEVKNNNNKAVLRNNTKITEIVFLISKELLRMLYFSGIRRTLFI